MCDIILSKKGCGYMKQWMANGLLVLVTIIWGGGFIATAAALDCFSPYGVMMIRFLGASVLPLLLSIPAWKTTTKEQQKVTRPGIPR